MLGELRGAGGIAQPILCHSPPQCRTRTRTQTALWRSDISSMCEFAHVRRAASSRDARVITHLAARAATAVDSPSRDRALICRCRLLSVERQRVAKRSHVCTAQVPDTSGARISVIMRSSQRASKQPTATSLPAAGKRSAADTARPRGLAHLRKSRRARTTDRRESRISTL